VVSESVPGSVHDKEAGGKVHAGQLVRFVDVKAMVSKLLGIFNTIFEFADGAKTPDMLKKRAKQFAEMLKKNTQKYYGFPSEIYIHYLIEIKDKETEISKRHEEIYDKLCEYLRLTDADGQVQRVASSFAVYILAGYYGVESGILPHTHPQIEDSIYYMFNRWLTDRGDGFPLG
jgi:hypothetical protein